MVSKYKINEDDDITEIPYNSLKNMREIGRTSHTVVYEGKYKKFTVAIKNSQGFSRRELSHHSSLSHPNIVKFIGAVTKDHRNMIVMELALAGSLSDRLKSGEPIPENLAYSWSNDTVAAIHYLHDNCIIHQDIKPENFLVFPNGLKACDFGISKSLNNGTTMASQNGGTMRYMPPERLKKPPLVSKKSDIYSLMIVIWEIMTGKRHFDKLSDYELAQQKLVPSPPKSIPDEWPSELKDLCFLCWETEYYNRPTISEVCRMLLDITENQAGFHVVQMANIKTTKKAPGYRHKIMSIQTQPNGNFLIAVKATSYRMCHKRCKQLPITCAGTGFVAERHQPNRSMNKADLVSQTSQGLIIAKKNSNGTTLIIKLNSEGYELERFYLTYKEEKSQQHVSSIATDNEGSIYALCRQKKTKMISSKLHTQRAKLFQFGEEVGEPLKEEDSGVTWSCLWYDPSGGFINQLFSSNLFKAKNAKPMLKIYNDHIYVNSWAYVGFVEQYKLDGSYVRTLRLNGARDFTVCLSGMMAAITDSKVALYGKYGNIVEEFEHGLEPMSKQCIAINGKHIIVATKEKTKVFKFL